MNTAELLQLAEQAPSTSIVGKFWRMVETQQTSATRTITDSIEEHDVLEAMLENNKPAYHPAALAAKLHYLLATPFRYPPLQHGSRFGSRHEPAMLYASASEHTLLWEVAYYKLVFWFDQAVLPKRAANVLHTSFQFSVNAPGLRLDQAPFLQHQPILTHPSSYTASQAVGKMIRQREIDLFTFCSARDPNRGRNLAVVTPKVLKNREPVNLMMWSCEFDASGVKFRKDHSREDIKEFPAAAFMVNGQLPRPA